MSYTKVNAADRPPRQCIRIYRSTGERCRNFIEGWRHLGKVTCSTACYRAEYKARKRAEIQAWRNYAEDRVAETDARLEGLAPMQALITIVVDPVAFGLTDAEALDRAHAAGVTFGGLRRLRQTYSPTNE